MEGNRIMSISFASSLTDVVEANESFDYGVLRVAYEGENRNKSSISHAAFEKALGSIGCVPVVANYSVEDDRIGGHDIGVIKDTKGNLRLINYTQPLGVVPESAKQWFEDVTEEDGTVHTYLFTDVVLWKRQAVYRKLKEDGITGHSMEISIKDGHKKDGVFYIDDFEFTAFCLLGEDIPPCFESSALETFSATQFKEDFANMMFELKEFAKQVNTPTGVDNKHPQENLMEGGNEVLSEKMELAAKYGVDVDSLDFSIEDFSLEELEKKFAEMTEDNGTVDENVATDENESVEDNATEDESDVADDDADETVVENNADESNNEDEEIDFALAQGIKTEIIRELEKAKFVAPWGTDCRFWFVDYDAEKSEVYAHDCEKKYLCGMSFVMKGDAVEIDFDSEKRMKYAIVDFNDGDEDNLQNIVNLLFDKIDDKCKENETLSTEFTTEKELYAAMSAELENLRNFKAEIEDAKAKEQRNAVFAMFTELEGIEAFEALKENCSDMTPEALRKECFAIRGEFGMNVNFSMNNDKGIKIKVVADRKEKEPYGGIVEKYISRD